MQHLNVNNEHKSGEFTFVMIKLKKRREKNDSDAEEASINEQQWQSNVHSWLGVGCYSDDNKTFLLCKNLTKDVANE